MRKSNWMKFKTLEDLRDYCNYSANEYKDCSDFEENAANHFKENFEYIAETDEKFDVAAVYKENGLNYGECETQIHETETYFVEEIDDYVEITWWEAYVDPCVSREDYFKGYVLTYID
jgi:hypothetical protein